MMPAFTAVGWIDLWDLAASLPARMGLFKGQGHRAIHLRGPSKSDSERIVWYEDAAKWPEIRAVHDDLSGMAAKVSGEVTALSLDMLDPGASWRMPKRDQIAIVALRSGPGCLVYCHDGAISPQQGAVIAPFDWVMLANYNSVPFIWASVSWRLGVPHAGGEAVGL